ncbi:MAG TPA: terpene synthase family protein [Nannocystis sp.]
MSKRFAIAQQYTARHSDEPARRGRFVAVLKARAATGLRAAAAAPDAGARRPTSSSAAQRHLMKIPALECPYLPAVHPAADDLHERTVAWAQAMGLVRKPEQIDALRDSRIGHLVARMFPASTDMVALQLAVDWTTLFCCLDDYLEQIHGAVLIAAYLRGLLGVFRDGRQPPLIDPFSHGFGDLRERMLDLRVPNWIPRFSACVERLFDAFIDEAKYRTINVVPEFASHRQIRQITVGLYTGFLLGELTERIVLPPEVLAHETVRELERAASTIVGLANDIYTVEKEIAKGEVNNTVLVLMHQDGLSFEEAMAHTVRLHNAEMREFSRLAENLPHFDDETDRQLRRYVEVLIAFISGHGDWARQNGRYDGDAGDGDASQD